MLTTIARFEFRYLLRNPLLWLTAFAGFALFVIGMSVRGFELGSEGGLLVNAACATLQNYVMASVLFMFVSTSFVANAVIRDDETGYGPIIRSTHITKVEYVFGRFLGAFAIAAACLAIVPLGILVGTLMPWADPTTIGPHRLIDHLYAYFVLALPNLLIQCALFFALATITRSMMATYLGVITFVSGFFTLQGSFVDRPQLRTAVTMLDPFGERAFRDATRYWTIAQRNVSLPDFTGPLLYNRLLWIGVAVICLAVTYAVFRFADQGASKRERKKQKLVEFAAAPRAIEAGSLPSPTRDSAATRALLWVRTKFEFKQVVVSPAFAVLLAWGLFTTIFVLVTQRDPDGRPRYPITLLLIPKIADAFAQIPLVVAIYYAGELVWRERDRRVHELVDASPMPTWAHVVPKTMAMALVMVSILTTTVVASVIAQLSLGYVHLELGKYLLWYVLPAAWDMLLLSALAVFIQALSPHKTIGWGIMVLFLLWQQLNTSIEHNLLNYGSLPRMPLSDLNGVSFFWQGPWTFRIYWGAFAVLLLMVAHLLWRRGTEIRLKPRIAHARRMMTGTRAWVTIAALAVFAGAGACAYYNTNVLNEYRTRGERDDDAAELEKKFWKYHDLPQPTIANLTLNVALYPGERRALTSGRYELRNRTQQPITDVHVRTMERDLELTRIALAGARLTLDDRKFAYRIYRLDQPMQPGEARVLQFETRRWLRGFRNRLQNTQLVENGTFLSNEELMPVIGMNSRGLLEEASTRRDHGLPPELPRAKADEAAATSRPALGAGWTKTDITVSTTADQTPLAPGSKVSDVTRGGRRTARFVSKAPVLIFFEVQSARYAEKHRVHAGVDLAVYYHPAHPWNVDRMLDALATSLDYYQANFGPYQFDHVRIVEFPGYRNFAQAFAGTIPYSETYGFISDFHKPETIDLVTGATAHELGHQYWAHQLVGAGMDGEPVLSETLAQYSAMMVLKKLQGEDHIRRQLQFELDRYLAGRSYDSADEPALARVNGQSWITYHKGALAMYLLQKRIGEEAVNRALRNLLQQFKFKGPPFARSLDLIAALRAEAKTNEEQNLITDLFERVTLYDLRVDHPTSVRRADGKWDVAVPVIAKKLYVSGRNIETETPINERIEVGLFTAEPGRDAFDAKNVITMERQAIHSGQQVLHFVSDKKPSYAGIDPYNFYIDRNSGDNVGPVS